jgi:acetyl-CoA C-acetyltransferase
MADPVVIVSGTRTAIGRFGGGLAGVEAYECAAACIRESLDRSDVAPDEVDEVVMGMVGQVGPDAFNARRCALAAGIPSTKTALTINRLCASGLQAIVNGAQQILLGDADVVVAGGNESMSRQPLLDFDARNGRRLGNHQLQDGTLVLLNDPWGNFPMGETAERVAERWHVTREEQDAFALLSQQRAATAIDAGWFDEEIVPIDAPNVPNPFAKDEHPRPDTTLETLQSLRPAFRKDGTVTAGNASGINDGAAAVVMMRESEARRRGLEPRLRFRSWAVAGIDHDVMGYAPTYAIPRAAEKAGVSLEDVDLVELNEAFAAQAVPIVRDLGLDMERVNVAGGAIALGHPIGATGAILTVKLMHLLARLDKRLGMVAMCIGGGQGMAAIWERSG